MCRTNYKDQTEMIRDILKYIFLPLFSNRFAEWQVLHTETLQALELLLYFTLIVRHFYILYTIEIIAYILYIDHTIDI